MYVIIFKFDLKFYNENVAKLRRKRYSGKVLLINRTYRYKEREKKRIIDKI